MHKLKLEAAYTSDIPFFDFDSQMDPWTIARQAVCAFLKENLCANLNPFAIMNFA